ncbi:MAG: hypothetical protein ABIH77_03070 [Pseudomonadota bacterium]|nr:hypothetical protein [Gammaproteobacteria bacterium]
MEHVKSPRIGGLCIFFQMNLFELAEYKILANLFRDNKNKEIMKVFIPFSPPDLPKIGGTQKEPELYALIFDEKALYLFKTFNQYAEKISLQGLEIKNNCIYPLAQCVISAPHLESLVLNGNDCSPKTSRGFIPIFAEACQYIVKNSGRKNTNLKNLDLSLNNLSSDELNKATNLLKSFTSIKTLNLSNNPNITISKEIAKKIAQNKTLQSLSLKGCWLEKTDIENLLDALAFQKSKTKLEELILSGKTIFDDTTVIPFEKLSDSNIKKLELHHLSLSIRDLEALTKVLKINQTLQTLTIDISHIMQDLSKQNALNSFISAAMTNKTLQELNVYDDEGNILELNVTHTLQSSTFFQIAFLMSQITQNYRLPNQEKLKSSRIKRNSRKDPNNRRSPEEQISYLDFFKKQPISKKGGGKEIHDELIRQLKGHG